MRIPRVHVEAELSVGADIALADAQSHYLKHVLRLNPGAALRLFNGREARDYSALLIASGKQLGARIESVLPVDTESSLQSEIIQGLGRADHTDWMIQKTTELGVQQITLFPAERTQSPPKSAQLEKKLQHWRSVAISACEQSGRAIVPGIHYYNRLDQALDACSAGSRLLLEFSGRPLPSSLPGPGDSVALLLGPEGGFNPDEIERAKSSGFTAVRIGPRVLRTETAASCALAVVQALVGDLN